MIKNVLFISHNGLTDSLGQAQILPYLIGLFKKGHNNSILSCEKLKNFRKNHSIVSQKCKEVNIYWHYIDYNNSIPATVMPLVGLNTHIVTHSENGLLATSENDWYEKLSMLIENKELRLQIG